MESLKTLILITTIVVIVTKSNADPKTSDTEDYCSSSLCKAGKKHIACKNSGALGTACPANTNLLDMNRFSKFILDEHNQKRNRIAASQYADLPAPSKMATMIWNDELAELALLNVKSCTPKYDQCFSTKLFQSPGQNIAHFNLTGIGLVKRKTNKKLIIESIHRWWSEIENVTISRLKSFPRTEVGDSIRHFAIMAKNNNTDIGCAAVRFVNDETHNFILTCNYGNDVEIDKPVYEFREPGCKLGRSKVFKNLCNIEEIYET